MKEKESLGKREQNLHELEKVTRGELHAASQWSDEVLTYVSVDKGSICVGKMMEKANKAYAEALRKLDKIREKQKKMGSTLHKLSIYSRSFKMFQTCLCNISFIYFYLETVAVIDTNYSVFSVSFTK